MLPDVYLAEMLRLPFFWRDSGPIYSWPPPVPSPAQMLGQSMLANPNFMRGPSALVTSEQIKERNEALQRDSERVFAHYKERDRQREERELKQGREAIAREVAERNRREGWP
jgi:hypothetical protein